MQSWTGKITEKTFKDWKDIQLYSFKIEGVDRWFRTGRQPIEQDVGATITFDERNTQVILDSVKVGPVGTPTVSETVPSVSGDSTQTSGTGNPQTVADRIRWQAARRDACNVMCAALKSDAMPWASNVAKSKKLDLLRGYINELTKQFIEEENNV